MILRISPGQPVYDAVLGMREVFTHLYRTYQPCARGPKLVQTDFCATCTKAFLEHCPEEGKGGQYLLMLSQDFDRLLPHLYPFGMAMFCQDVVESLNRLLKLAYTEHSAHGGGHPTATGDDPTTGLPAKWAFVLGVLLQQCIGWVFLYFDIHIVCQGVPRPAQCTVARVAERLANPPPPAIVMIQTFPSFLRRHAPHDTYTQPPKRHRPTSSGLGGPLPSSPSPKTHTNPHPHPSLSWPMLQPPRKPHGKPQNQSYPHPYTSAHPLCQQVV